MSAPVNPAVPPVGANASPARAWVVFTAVLTLAVFFQAVTAGRILTGDEWARDVHSAAAGLLFVVALGGGLVALVRLRDRANGRRFAWMLLALGVGLFVQHGLGSAAADGEDTLWLHVPLGVALLGFFVLVNGYARRVGVPE
jgi:cytochrome bd-type quinol oxidase subunit 2